MRLDESIVEGDRLAERFDRQRGLAVAVVGERQLVEDAWRAVVEGDESAVLLDGVLVPPHRDVDVAEELDRAGRAGIQRRGLAEVAQRRRQLAAAAVGIAALEIREHGVGLERERAAERFDRDKRLVLNDGGIPGGDQALEFAVLADGIPGDQDADDEGGDAHGYDDQAFHG